MENDPTQLRTETAQPLLGSEARVEYYDAQLEWVTPRFGIRKAAETVYPYAQKVLKSMDWLGGKFADGLGLTSSRFQYALDEYNRRERKMLEKLERERDKARALQHQQGLVDEDDSRLPYVPPMSLIFIQSASGAENNGDGLSASSSDKKKSSGEGGDEEQEQRKRQNQKLVDEALLKTKAYPAPAAASAAASHSAAAAAAVASSTASAKPSAAAAAADDDDDDDDDDDNAKMQAL